MIHDTYAVYIDNIPVAQKMDLNTAIVLMKGLFQEYYNETDLKIIIARETNDNEEPESWDK